jgi:cytoskeletal protein CcmA (bactofilin family)
MLDARKPKTYNETKVTSIVGPGTKIRGEVTSEGTIRIEGYVEGQVQSADTIVVQENGKVKADLIGGQVIISGEVHGNVFAHDRLEITPSARVHGDITSPRISIAEGVVFEGKCTMKSPAQALKAQQEARGGAAPQQAAPQQAAPQQAAPQQQAAPAPKKI